MCPRSLRAGALDTETGTLRTEDKKIYMVKPRADSGDLESSACLSREPCRGSASPSAGRSRLLVCLTGGG